MVYQAAVNFMTNVMFLRTVVRKFVQFFFHQYFCLRIALLDTQETYAFFEVISLKDNK
jgi:hypothetical protein